MEPTGIIESIEQSLAEVPLFFVALALLTGPTVALIIYSLATSKRARRWITGRQELYWLCVACNSINRDSDKACYRCRMVRGTAVPHVGESPSQRPSPVPLPVSRPAPATAEALKADEPVGVPVMDGSGEAVGVPVMDGSGEAVGSPARPEPRPTRVTRSRTADGPPTPATGAPLPTRRRG